MVEPDRRPAGRATSTRSRRRSACASGSWRAAGRSCAGRWPGVAGRPSGPSRSPPVAQPTSVIQSFAFLSLNWAMILRVSRTARNASWGWSSTGASRPRRRTSCPWPGRCRGRYRSSRIPFLIRGAEEPAEHDLRARVAALMPAGRPSGDFTYCFGLGFWNQKLGEFISFQSCQSRTGSFSGKLGLAAQKVPLLP